VSDDWYWVYQFGVGAIIVLYIALIVVCIVALWPVEIFNPIAPEWDLLTTAYKGLNEKETVSQRLSSVLNAIELNKPLLKRVTKLQATALVLLPTLVVILILLTLLPRG
jgi:quinol-cytochrome oxidoreductase complex cytochrome b subunit